MPLHLNLSALPIETILALLFIVPCLAHGAVRAWSKRP